MQCSSSANTPRVIRAVQFLIILAGVVGIVAVPQAMKPSPQAETTVHHVGRHVAYDFWLPDGTRCIAWSQGGIACEFSGLDGIEIEADAMAPTEPTP